MPHTDALLLCTVQRGITLHIHTFSALYSFETSYSTAGSSWEVPAFKNTSSILWRHPKKVNNYFDILLHFFRCKATLQLTTGCRLNTGEEKGNIALFILHKVLNIFQWSCLTLSVYLAISGTHLNIYYFLIFLTWIY